MMKNFDKVLQLQIQWFQLSMTHNSKEKPCVNNYSCRKYLVNVQNQMANYYSRWS